GVRAVSRSWLHPRVVRARGRFPAPGLRNGKLPRRLQVRRRWRSAQTTSHFSLSARIADQRHFTIAVTLATLSRRWSNSSRAGRPAWVAKLDRYREMRDFHATPEPAGGRQTDKEGNRFVVQEHHA